MCFTAFTPVFLKNLIILGNLHMGVTIAFKGKLKSADLIPTIIEEVEDICKSNDWSYKIVGGKKPAETSVSPDVLPRPFSFENDDDDDDNDDFDFKSDDSEDYDFGLKGISFQPHKDSENVELLFDTEGVLRSIFSMLISESARHKYRWIFVKTQFAGVQTHIKVVNLLNYLRKQYFSRLTIKDEGGYYPKNDLKTLTTRMDFIDSAIATMKDVFENGEFSGTPDEILERIQAALSQSFKELNVQVIKIDTDDFPEDLKQKYIDNFTDFDEEYRQRRKREEWDDDEEF